MNKSLIAIVLLSGGAAAHADSFFASRVIDAVPGTGQMAAFADPSLALGGPAGAGADAQSYDVYNLGIGGSLTLGFDAGGPHSLMHDGPGADFLVFENAFYAGGDVASSFAELVYVEVSSNSVDFARFPTNSNTPAPVNAYGTIDPADVSGFAGVHPVYANVSSNSVNPFDPAVAGGDAFDLSVLANHPLVKDGKLDLNAISQVRLVDVVGDGTQLDSAGHPIYDPTGPGSNGADIDALGVINGGALLKKDGIWKGPGGGIYHDPANWVDAFVPSGAGASADLSASAPGGIVTLDSPVTLGGLTLGEYANGIDGVELLTLDGAGVEAIVDAGAGVHTIAAPVAFTGDVTLSAGGGTIVFSGPLNYADGTRLHIVDGTVEFDLNEGGVSVGRDVNIFVDGATLSLAGRVDPFSDSITGQALMMSYGAVPEPGLLPGLLLASCLLRRRKRGGHA